MTTASAEAVTVLADSWSNNWLWSLPLIVGTVLVHGLGLIEIREHVAGGLERSFGAARSRTGFAQVIAATVLSVTALHALEASAWATAYVALGAMPGAREAMLYSLNAMTSYGHAEIFLAPHWRLMGALEALNGMMLFGLTTAFLFSTLHSYWPADSHRKKPLDSNPERAKVDDADPIAGLRGPGPRRSHQDAVRAGHELDE